jgi:hypothetical protein
MPKDVALLQVQSNTMKGATTLSTCGKEAQMASNFRISVYRNSNSLDLKLVGDFDGTSACELLNVLKEKCNSVDRVLINTSGLKEIHPFGQDTFHNNIYLLKAKPCRFVFTGRNATQIAPDARPAFDFLAIK